MKRHIEFQKYSYKNIADDQIDSDRYFIPFILTTKNEPPLRDKSERYIITIEIAGSILASIGLWNCEEEEMIKIIFAHAFEYIKSLITSNKLTKEIYLNLDKTHLENYPIDPNKVREINNYNFDFEIENPTKTFGFHAS